MKNNKLKILQVNKLYYPVIGGVEKVVQDISEGVNDEFDVKVLVCNSGTASVTEKVNGIEVTRAGSVGSLFSMPVSLSFPFVFKELSKDSDILHFHFPFPLGDISCLMFKPKGKIVITWHSDIVKQKNVLSLYQPFLKKFLKRADRIVATSPNMIEHSVFLSEIRNKCSVIPLSINMEDYRRTGTIDEKVRALRSVNGDKIVLFIGRLVYYKGVEYLIRAMSKINAKLVIIGDGPLELSLKELAIKTEVADKIIWLKNIPDAELKVYYHACDVFTLPSVERSEAFGLVQLEAMACRKPVVSTDLLTGVPFVNQHDKTGFIVPPRDDTALAEAINKLLAEPSLRESMGDYAFKRVEKEFNRKKMLSDYISLYKDVVSYD